jgi:hypothetical protein
MTEIARGSPNADGHGTIPYSLFSSLKGQKSPTY